MSRLFDDAQLEYLKRAQAVITSAVPYAVVAWFNTDNNGLGQTLFSVQDKDVDNQWARLSITNAAKDMWM